MSLRRVATGHDLEGKSIVISDGVPPRTVNFLQVPGLTVSMMWETSVESSVGKQPADPTVSAKSWVPQMGGTNAFIVTYPPASKLSDPDAAIAEYAEKLPGLAERYEPDAPGMHTTDSIDYAVVLDGEMHLELDAGHIEVLKRHDFVVQNGTRHAWRNLSDQPATMLFVLIAAPRVT